MPCLIEVDLDGSCEFCRTEKRKARKEHKCGECKGKILKGEEYEYVAGMWERCFSTHKTCSACLEIRNVFMKSYYYGTIWEELHECALELTIGDIDDLSINAIGKLEEQMAEVWEEYCDEWEVELYPSES